MTAERTSLRSLFSESKIFTGSKRLSFGQDGKTLPQMLRDLVADPAALSVTLHELAHFHSLISPLGLILTARALTRGHWLDRTLSIAEEGGDLAPAMLKFVHSSFQLERTVTAYEPLLEGIAVFLQTSLPCRDIDDLSKPLSTLYGTAVMLSGLGDPDPASHSTPLTPDAISRGILPAAYDALAKGAQFPFSGDGSDLATELELSPGEETLPYFLGHAYVRGIHARVSEAIPDWECPEHFFDLLLRLLAARRTGPKEYDLRGKYWVDMVYGWNMLFRSASNKRIADIERLPRQADILEWLLDEGIDEQVEPLAQPKNAVDFLNVRMPDWKVLSEGEIDMVEAINNIVLLTQMMNLSEGGPCRLVGRVRHGDLGSFYVLEVSGERWLLRLPDDAMATLGIGPSELTELDEAGAVPWTGPSLTMSLYVTEGMSLGLGDGPFPSQPRNHYLFWIGKEGEPDAGFAAVPKAEKSLKRFVLQKAPQPALAHFPLLRQGLREMLEDRVRMDAFTAMLQDKLGWKALRDSMEGNQNKQDAALATIRTLWTRQILFDLLGPRGRDLAGDIVASRMRNVLLDTKSVRRLLRASYGGPALMHGPGTADMEVLIDISNKLSMQSIGHAVFRRVPPRGVIYQGLWGSSAWTEKRLPPGGGA